MPRESQLLILPAENGPIIEEPNDQNQQQVSKLEQHKQQFEKIKKDLKRVVESINTHPSLLTRASAAWVKMSWWWKILIGIALVVPALLIGIFAHVAVLITLAVCFGVVYGLCYFLFHNHQKHNVSIEKNLNKGVNGAVDIFSEVTHTLDVFSDRFEEDIKKLEEENKELSATVVKLNAHEEELAERGKQFMEIEGHLRDTSDDLGATAGVFRESVEEHKDLLLISRADLERYKEYFEQSHEDLSKQVLALGKVNEDLNGTLVAAKGYSDLQETMLKELKGVVFTGAASQEEYLERLSEFFAKKETDLGQVVVALRESESEMGRQLKEARAQIAALERSNDRYQEQLKQGERQVQRLESIAGTAEAMAELGLFRKTTEQPAIRANQVVYSASAQ